MEKIVTRRPLKNFRERENDLIRNKAASGRAKGLIDLEELKKL